MSEGLRHFEGWPWLLSGVCDCDVCFVRQVLAECGVLT